MNGTIDRFEGGYCIIELADKSMINVELEKIPLGAKEGDILEIQNNEKSIDSKETDKRKAAIEEKVKDLWE